MYQFVYSCQSGRLVQTKRLMSFAGILVLCSIEGNAECSQQSASFVQTVVSDVMCWKSCCVFRQRQVLPNVKIVLSERLPVCRTSPAGGR